MYVGPIYNVILILGLIVCLLQTCSDPRCCVVINTVGLQTMYSHLYKITFFKQNIHSSLFRTKCTGKNNFFQRIFRFQNIPRGVQTPTNLAVLERFAITLFYFIIFSFFSKKSQKYKKLIFLFCTRTIWMYSFRLYIFQNQIESKWLLKCYGIT